MCMTSLPRGLALLLILLVIPIAQAQVWNLHVTWVDEDTNGIVNPTVTVDGTTATVSNGVMDFNVVDKSSVVVISSLTDFSTKTFDFGFDGNIIDTVTMLKDLNAFNVEFKLRTDTNSTLITDGNFVVIDQNTGNLVARRTIPSTSIVSTILKPVGKDYNFMITSTTQDFNFNKEPIDIKDPIDESTLVNLGTGATKRVSGIGTFTFGQADTFSETFLSDTFTQADNTAPDSSLWDIIDLLSDGNVSINTNALDLNSVSQGSNDNIFGIQSDINIIFNVGDSVEVKFTSNERPVSTTSDHGVRIQLSVSDATLNPKLSSTSRMGIYRQESGALGSVNGHVNDESQNDGGTGSKNLRFVVKRTTSTNYNVKYFIDDTNKFNEFDFTDSNTTWKLTVFAEASAAGGQTTTGTVDTISVKKIVSDSVFPYTTTFYIANVDFNTLYHPRDYYFRLSRSDFNESNKFEIQPYLATTEKANIITIRLQRIFDITENLDSIRILIEKLIQGQSFTEIQTVVTGASGQHDVSLIPGDEYRFTLFDPSDNQILQRIDIMAASQTVLSISTEIVPLFPSGTQFNIVVGFDPSGGTITNIDQNVTITLNYDVNVSIADFNIIIQQNDVNITDYNNFTIVPADPAITDINLSQASDLNISSPWKIIVNVKTADGNSFFFTSGFNIARLIGGVDFLNDIIRGEFKTDLECKANDFTDICFPTMMFSLLFQQLLLVV